MKTVVDSKGINTIPGAPSLEVHGDLSISLNDKLVNVGDLLKDLEGRIYRFKEGPSCACSEQFEGYRILLKTTQDDLMNTVNSLNALMEEVKTLKQNVVPSTTEEEVKKANTRTNKK
jgi:hypothetical protein